MREEFSCEVFKNNIYKDYACHAPNEILWDIIWQD